MIETLGPVAAVVGYLATIAGVITVLLQSTRNL